MRITGDYKKNKMQSGTSTLREATENAPTTTGFYTIILETEKVYMGVAEKGLRQEFIELYNGFHLDGETASVKIYENRDNIVVDWAEEYSVENAKEYVEKVVSTEQLAWNK